MSDEVRVSCTVNGEAVQLAGHPLARLLDVIRLQLHLTGTKEGCGEGECGACGILLNGRLVNSCLVPLLHAEGADIVTIEGLAAGDRLHRIQQAFVEHGGAQCGICTSGMIIAAAALLDENSRPSLDEIRVGLAGNLCRCTGYLKIFESVAAAFDESAPR